MTDRIFGYELSEIERALTFRENNAGYVRWEDKKNRIAYLDPSPFLKTSKSEVYVFLTDKLPDEHTLVRVEVEKAEEKYVPVSKMSVEFRTIRVKYVSSWKEIDVFSILKGVRPLLPGEMFEEVLKYPFRESDVSASLDAVAKSLAVYLASSPPEVSKGGITAGCLVERKMLWNAMARLMSTIPQEFRRIESPYYYELRQKEILFNPEKMNPKEINMDFLNPQGVPIHIPQPLIGLEARSSSEYREWLRELTPLMRAKIYQMVLLKPKPSESAEKEILEKIYEAHNRLLSEGVAPFQPDMDFVKRVSLSIARIDMHESVTSRIVDEAFDTWLEAYELSLRISNRVDVKNLYKLSKLGTKLYLIFREIGDEVDERTLYLEAIKRGMHEFEIEDAIRELKTKGFVYAPRHGVYRIVEV